VRPDRGEVDGRGQRAQGLVGADVAGGLLAADVLLAGTQGHDERALAVDVRGHADETAGDLADQGLAAGQDAEVRAAVRERDAQRLAFAGRRCRRRTRPARQDGERDRLHDRHEQRAGGVGQAADLGHRLEQAEEARVGDDHAGHRMLRVGEHPLERRQVGRAGGRSLSDERDLVGDERCPAEVRAQRLTVVGMDAPADQHPLPARRAAAHEGALGRGRGAVVVRGRDDVQAGQLGHERLVLVDRLERALADLRLVRRVGGVELAAQEQLVDDRRHEVAVGPGAEEAHQIDPVALGQIAQSSDSSASDSGGGS
jgi:hypothetical protein